MNKITADKHPLLVSSKQKKEEIEFAKLYLNAFMIDKANYKCLFSEKF